MGKCGVWKDRTPYVVSHDLSLRLCIGVSTWSWSNTNSWLIHPIIIYILITCSVKHITTLQFHLKLILRRYRKTFEGSKWRSLPSRQVDYLSYLTIGRGATCLCEDHGIVAYNSYLLQGHTYRHSSDILSRISHWNWERSQIAVMERSFGHRSLLDAWTSWNSDGDFTSSAMHIANLCGELPATSITIL